MQSVTWQEATQHLIHEMLYVRQLKPLLNAQTLLELNCLSNLMFSWHNISVYNVWTSIWAAVVHECKKQKHNRFWLHVYCFDCYGWVNFERLIESRFCYFS